MATVNNVVVEIQGIQPFEPKATSRIGFDVEYSSPSEGTISQLTLPAFKLMLRDLPSQSLTALEQWWQNAKTGNPQAKDVTVIVQTPSGLTKRAVLEITMAESHIVGFSDGVLAPPYIVIKPGQMRVPQSPSINVTEYSGMDLAALLSPRFNLKGFVPLLLHRASGGEESLAGEFTDIKLTILAWQKSGDLDLGQFNQIRQWLDNLLESGVAVGQEVRFSKMGGPTGNSVVGTQDHFVVPVRVNLINPLLVVTGGVAPYVWDLVLRPIPIP